MSITDYSDPLRLFQEPSRFEVMLIRLERTGVFYLFSFFDALRILRLQKVNQLLRAISQTYSTTAWDFERFANEWFRNGENFRNILHRTSAVLSGSAALQFFARERYPSSDMDIYVRKAGSETLARWVIHEGYHQASAGRRRYSYSTPAIMPKNRPSSDVRNHGGLIEVHNFVKHSIKANSSVTGRRLQIIIVDVEPLDHILYNFHSSKSTIIYAIHYIDFHSAAVMNIITSCEAICLFPRWTLIKRVSYVTRKGFIRSRERNVFVEKYEARGFRVVGHESIGRDPGPGYGRRWVKDARCWTIQFQRKCCQTCTKHSNSNVQARPHMDHPISGKMDIDIPFEVLPALPGLEVEEEFLRIAQPMVWR